MPERDTSATLRVVTGIAATVLACALALTVMDLPTQPGGLTALAQENLEASAVTHPVTAVLLNFRAYDTWLELGVLLLALIGLLSSQRASDLKGTPAVPAANLVLVWLVRLLAPVALTTAGYLLWLGTHAPGGAFQAGAVLGAAGVLLSLAGHRPLSSFRGAHLRWVAISGFAVFLAVALGVMGSGRSFLQYPPEWAGGLILFIEIAATVGIGLALAALFAGAKPFPDAGESGQ